MHKSIQKYQPLSNCLEISHARRAAKCFQTSSIMRMGKFQRIFPLVSDLVPISSFNDHFFCLSIYLFISNALLLWVSCGVCQCAQTFILFCLVFILFWPALSWHNYEPESHMWDNRFFRMEKLLVWFIVDRVLAMSMWRYAWLLTTEFIVCVWVYACVHK